jgi:hypothetical protein
MGRAEPRPFSIMLVATVWPQAPRPFSPDLRYSEARQVLFF